MDTLVSMSRIFLSHASPDKPIVRRIAAALRDEGFEVWLDEDEILVGESIPAAVERELRDADFVVLCLSKAAAERGWTEAERDAAMMQQFRDRRERILPVRLEEVVPPYLVASLAYVDLFPVERAFTPGIARLTTSIRTYEKRHAGGSHPWPGPSVTPSTSPHHAGIDFTVERARHARFVGRAALLAQLDRLLIADSVDWIVVTGGPGMGKSALLAAWLARREAAGDRVPHHFIRRGEYDWDDPAKLVGSLVAQIVARFPDQCEAESDARMHPAARLQTIMHRVSKHQLVPHGERLVVLIDGLDEYDPLPDSRAAAPGRDPLAEFLPSSLPPGVSLLCTSRRRPPYVEVLAARGALQLDLDSPAFAADNAATVRAFWEQEAPKLDVSAEFVAEAVERADGNPQHAEMLRKYLAGLAPEQRHVENIPAGLAGLLARTWDRMRTEPAVVEGLGVLCAAREALTLDELEAVTGWAGSAQREAFKRGALEVLIETRRTVSVSEYRLHHDSIRTYIAEAIGNAAILRHHLALAERLATWPAPADAAGRRYALHHALLHRSEAGAWRDAWRIAADVAFLEAKCRELGAQEVEVDIARTAERCRTHADEALGKRFGDLARALGRESHWLRAAPEATAALVWNRLRQTGWSVEELEQQLQLPTDARFVRVRHVATRESPALERTLVGHAASVTACAVTQDGQRVVSASQDGTLKVWDLPTGALMVSLEGHAAEVRACAVTPDGRHVVSVSYDRTFKVWDLETGTLMRTLNGPAFAANACAVTPDGRRVVSASNDSTLKIWDLSTGELLATLEGHKFGVNACAVTPDGRRVVSASQDGTLPSLPTYLRQRPRS